MRASRWPLTLIRLYLGVVFAVAGVMQWLGLEPWGSAADWAARLDQYLQVFHSHPVAFYHAFLVAHHGVVAAVAPPLHIAIGIWLLSGFRPRVAAGVALAVLVSYLALTGFMPWHPDPVAALAWLALTVVVETTMPLRLYIAAAFLIGTVGRVRDWAGWHDEVSGFLGAYLPFAAPFYRPVMRLALAYVAVFAWLVFLGEAVAGIAIVVGHAEVGMFLSLNYLLSKGNTPWSFNNDFAFLVAMLAVQCSRPVPRWRWRWWPSKAESPGTAGPMPSSASPPS